MQCPHCLHDIFPASSTTLINTLRTPKMKGGPHDSDSMNLHAAVHTCPRCGGAVLDIRLTNTGNGIEFGAFRAYPRGGPFPPAPSEVPGNIAQDYAEANEVLPISPKASAALARRCLQSILSAHGYKGRDLVKQIDAVLAETDTSKSLPTALRENIDAVRNFGNFSAHPITDQTSLQIVDVEPGEAEWCLQLLMDAFDHYYVAPAKAAAKRAGLAAKLAAAGKPPMKTGEMPISPADLVKDGVDNAPTGE